MKSQQNVQLLWFPFRTPAARLSVMVEFQHSSLTGQVLDGRYRVLEKIGAGGMGDVYLAEQLAIDRKVAVKVLRPSGQSADDELFRQRFLREASSTAKLTHPNTVKIFDSGQTPDGLLFLVMEYLEGQTLSAVSKLQGAQPWLRVVDIGMQICRSVREAHGMGLIHRDLKPANVMVLSHMQEQHFIKVLDFGLVKSVETNDVDATQANMLLGSPTFMAPEQSRGLASVQSDLYSIGVILFQLLCGRPPFEGKTSLEVLLAHVQNPVPSLLECGGPHDIPPNLEHVIRRCLEKNPANRFESADALIAALKASVGQPLLTETSYPAVRLPVHATPMPFSKASGAPMVSVPMAASAESLMPSLGSPSAEEAPASRSLVFLVVAGCVSVIAGSLFLVSAMASSNPASPASPQATAGIRSDNAKPVSVAFAIDSIPEGASVYYSGQLVGTTPHTLSVPRDAKAEATTVQFTLVKEGYLSASVHASGVGATVTVSERLEPNPQPSAPAEATKAKQPAATALTRASTKKAKTKGVSPTPAPAASEPVAPTPVTEAPRPRAETAAPVTVAAVEAERPVDPVPSPSPKIRNVPAFVMEKEVLTRGPIRLSEGFKAMHRGEALSGLYRLCVGVAGRVDSVDVVKTVSGADEAIVAGIKEGWQYKPQAVKSCFLYNMPVKVD